MSSFAPDGWPTITPRLITPDVAGVVEFLREVFDGEGGAPNGRPAEIRIGESMVMVSDGGGLRQATAGFLYVYVPSVDDTYRRAMDAGATSLESPADTPYGDRRAMFEDRWGNLWQVAARKRAT